MVRIRLKRELLDALKIPDIDYPVPIHFLKGLNQPDAVLYPEQLLAWLMQYPTEEAQLVAKEDEAKTALSVFLTGEDNREEIWVHGDEWGVVLGRVDLSAEIISINHQNRIVALIQENGRHKLKISCFHPLTFPTANTLLEYLVPVPVNEYNPNGTKWKLAIKHSGSTMDYYHAEAGSPYHGYWPWGFGKTQNGIFEEGIKPYLSKTFLKPAQIAVQLGIFYENAEHVNLGYVPDQAPGIIQDINNNHQG